VRNALAHYLEGALEQSNAPIEDGDGTPVSAQQLLARARALARDLSAVQPDEPVLGTIANSPTDLAVMLGIWLAGGVVVPVHVDTTAAAAQRAQQAAGARFRVAPGGIEAVSASSPPARALLRGAALIIFTSGSTGHPKGVVIGHDRMAAKLDVLGRLVRLDAADHVVVPLRLTFIFGIWVVLLALRSSSRVTLIAKPIRENLAKPLLSGGTVLAAVPTMLRGLLAGGAPDAPALRAILTGGETLGAALGAALRAALPQTGIYDLYGLTETGSCDFCLQPSEQARAAGSIGRPIEQVTYRLVGEDGRLAANGATGELCIRTPFGMLGYLDDPGLTASSFVEGYFRTGDLARTRADGRLEIVGRLKDIISRGSNKIAPAEIDAVLCSHPDVAAALCAGVPDARLGEAIHAIVVAKPNAALTPDALRGWVAESLERYKVPDAIHFHDALPVGSTGKVRRAAVAEIVLGLASQRRA
jgi:long-chain acyl-CoA synthetase